MKNNIIGLKELRENTDIYISRIQKGQSFIVVRKSKPIFKLTSPDESDTDWEIAVDFTRVKKGGVALDDILSRI